MSVGIFFSSFDHKAFPHHSYILETSVRNTQGLRVGVNLPGFKTAAGEMLSIFRGCGFVTDPKWKVSRDGYGFYPLCVGLAITILW